MNPTNKYPVGFSDSNRATNRLGTLKEEKEEHVKNLRDKVQELKHISIGIRDHMGQESELRKDLHENFQKSQHLLKKTMQKMDHVFTKASGSLTVWVILFVIFFFLLLYKFG